MTTSHQPDSDLSAHETLQEMLTGRERLQMLYVAAKLGIADHLKDGPKSADQLAELAGAHPRALYRLLRALASLGIFAENDSGQFELTPLADLLRSDAPNSLRNTALWQGEPYRWLTSGQLLYSIKSGQTAFDHVHNMGVFEYFDQHPDDAAVFNQAMTIISNAQGAAVPEAYDFGAAGTIVDIGAGHGAFMTGILTSYPNVRGILFDQPAVIEGARPQLTAAGLIDRCQLVGGSFFEAESLPRGGDIYILKDIIHDWDEERSLAILNNCRQIIAGSARLLLIERVIPPGNAPSIGKMIDITMLLMTGGEERTAAEYGTLLDKANFKLTRIVPTTAEIDVIEAVPV